MSSRIPSLLLQIVISAAFQTGVATAQEIVEVPVLTGIFPPGATIGQTTEWTISGRNLAKVRSVVISGGGFEVVGWTPESESSLKVKVRVSDDAAPGVREVRVDGPSGVSNLALVRVDRLRQVSEAEPNDGLDEAQSVDVGTAVAGLLKPLDLDHFRIRGTPGQRVTIDLEARRIGSSFSPVVTISRNDGLAIVQGRASRRPDQECVMSVVLPDDGVCVVQVRDNIYAGGDLVTYRLRVDPAPFASSAFPLGGQRGENVRFEIGVGNLARLQSKSIQLPQTAGILADPGFVETANGPVEIPFSIAVGDGPKVLEGWVLENDPETWIRPGMVVNGRIGQPGEVDFFRFVVRTGDKIRLRVEAASLGSWLDSVLTLRDAEGKVLAENDDSEPGLRLDRAAADSSIQNEAKSDGTLTVEVSDRFSDGGLEFPYRLIYERDRDDLALNLQIANPKGSVNSSGALNLKPGSLGSFCFLVAAEGRPGPVEIKVEGLPPGVTADPVRIRFPGPKSSTSARGEPIADFIPIQVGSTARPGLYEIRVVGRATPTPGVTIEREALAKISVGGQGGSSRPVTRVIRRIPLRILEPAD